MFSFVILRILIQLEKLPILSDIFGLIYLLCLFHLRGIFIHSFLIRKKLHKVTRKIKTPRGYKEIVDCYRELLIPHRLEESQDISPEEIEDALNEKVCCLHCGAEYPYRETKIIVDEFGDEFTVCKKNFPECDGHDVDLMPAGYEKYVKRTISMKKCCLNCAFCVRYKKKTIQNGLQFYNQDTATILSSEERNLAFTDKF